MSALKAFLTLFAACCIAASAPAMAQNGKTPPGDPCGSGPGKGTGNPCKGNNGNEGANGNVGEKVKVVDPFEFEDIVVPDEKDRGVFITQVGSSNTASATQKGGNY